MEERRRTWFDDRGLVLRGAGGQPARHVPFVGAALHYWRTPRASWRRSLAELKTLGIEFVESYVPWSVHERSDGSFDWSDTRDLNAWLSEVAAAGLLAILRPGPQINAELTYFGFPARVLHDPAIQARAAHGGPVWLPAPPRAFPVPSYASQKFHDEVASWFDALAKEISERRWPDGPIVALQVDNEPQQFFRQGAFDHDYHPDAIAAWRRDHDDEPPRAWSPHTAAACAAWVRFKDAQIAAALAQFARQLESAGLGEVARFGNMRATGPWSSDMPALARAIDGPIGIDVYPAATSLDAVRTRGLHLVGTQTIPLVPELGCGFAPYLPPAADRDQRAATLTLLAAGIRGWSFYMGVNRDRWVGGMLDAQGRPDTPTRWITPLLAALAEVDWPRLRRVAPVALVASRADVRHGLASSLLDPVTPLALDILGLGPAGSSELGRDPAACTYRRWFAAAAAALDLAAVPYVIVDEGADLERFLAARAVIAPTLARVDRSLWRTLKRVADAKHLVVIGPELPTLDELGHPLGDEATPPRKAGLMRAASLDDLPGLAADLAGLSPPARWSVERPSPVHVHTFTSPEQPEQARVVFLVHTGDAPHTARLRGERGVVLSDAISGERFVDESGVITLTVDARDARMFVVER